MDADTLTRLLCEALDRGAEYRDRCEAAGRESALETVTPEHYSLYHLVGRVRGMVGSDYAYRIERALRRFELAEPF